MLEFEGKQIETDAHGYLKNVDNWSVELVPLLADEEGIELSEAHWEVIHFVRDFYKEFNTSPAIRMLVKAMAKKNTVKKKAAHATSINFFLKGRQSKPPS